MFQYVSDIIGNKDLLALHKDTIQRIIDGNFTLKNIEKLSGHDIYSVRLGDAERLLFTITEQMGKKHLLILDYLPTHDYHKSRFLRSGVLKRYKDKVFTTPEFDDIESRPVFEPAQDLSRLKNLTQEQGQAVPVDFYKGQWITLDNMQKEIVHVQLPAIVNGGPGSGKSCIALSALSHRAQALKNNAETEHAPLLYITQNPKLIEELKGAWLELPTADIDATQVQFKTYRDLLPAETQFSTPDFFHHWYKSTRQQDKARNKCTQKSPLELSEKALYEAFRLCSGYDEESYIAQDEDVLKRSERQAILHALKRYYEHLDAHGLTDMALTHFKFDSDYEMVVIDETQDFSHRQMVNLVQLAKNKQVICFMDSHQRLNDSDSIRPFLLQLLGIDKKSPQHVQLEKTYRCPPRILAVGNTVIRYKHQLVQGIADKYEATQLDSSQMDALGAVHLVKSEDLFAQPWVQNGDSRLAVVTTEENKTRALHLFNTPLVFTPAEIKGLEYPFVIGFELYKPKFFKEALQRWQVVKEKSPSKGRSKNDEGNHFITTLNEIFTAYTRAQQRLIICEDNNHYTSPLLDLIKPYHEPLPETLNLPEANLNQWEDELRNQINHGNTEKAKLIFEMKLAKQGLEFEHYKNNRPPLPQLKPSTPQPIVLPTMPPLKSIELAKPCPIKTRKNKRKMSPNDQHLSQNELIVAQNETNASLNAQKRERLTATILHKDFTENRIASMLATPSISLHRIFVEKHLGTDSLLTWMLQEKQRTQILVRCLLHHLPLFNNEEFSSELIANQPANEAFTLFHEFLAFKQRCTELNRWKKRNPRHALIHILTSIGECCTALIQDYVRLGGDINFQTEQGLTAMIVAAQHGHLKLIPVLHALGADLNQSMQQGATPALVAAKRGDKEILTALHERGVNLNLPTKEGVTPVFIAAQEGQAKLMKILQKLGANLNVLTQEHVSPALIAAQYGRTQVIKALRELGANLNQPDKNGLTPAFFAAIKNDDALALQLIKQVSFQEKHTLSETLLAPIFSKMSKENLDSLKERHPDIDLSNLEAATQLPFSPFDIAVLLKSKKVIRVVVEHQNNLSNPPISNHRMFQTANHNPAPIPSNALTLTN